MSRNGRAGAAVSIEAEEISVRFAPRMAEDVGITYVEDQAVLFDGRTGDAHLLNSSGALLVSSFDGTVTLEELAGEIAALVSVNEDVVRNDILGLTRGLGAAGVLDRVVPTPRVERGLEIGTTFPQFAAINAFGDRVGAWHPPAGTRALLVYWSPTCGFCTRIAPGLAQVADLTDVGITLVTTAGASEVSDQVRALGLGEVEVLAVRRAPSFFAGVGTPAAYAVAPDGRVEAPLSLGAIDVDALLGRIISRG